MSKTIKPEISPKRTLRDTSKISKILAIETSCDECSAAVVERTEYWVKPLSNVVFSQIDLHNKFGGVVPEIASRNHLEMLSIVIDEALEKAKSELSELQGIAVTQRPGLIGALLVGLSAAKTIAYSLDIPLIGVDHLQGHLHSLFIDDQPGIQNLSSKNLPLLVLLASGGHTNLYLIKNLPPAELNSEKLSESRDDAAGEAFDKTAKLLGLSYPGGVQIDRLAATGSPSAYRFPRPLPGDNLEFSFSGIKTAVATMLKSEGFEPHIFGEIDHSRLPDQTKLADYCASIQEAIASTLVRKILLALEKTNAKGLAVVGGVSANSRLRALLSEKIEVPLFFPSLEYCTDNAAMIGACGLFMAERGEILTGKDVLKANAFSS